VANWADRLSGGTESTCPQSFGSPQFESVEASQRDPADDQDHASDEEHCFKLRRRPIAVHGGDNGWSRIGFHLLRCVMVDALRAPADGSDRANKKTARSRSLQIRSRRSENSFGATDNIASDRSQRGEVAHAAAIVGRRSIESRLRRSWPSSAAIWNATGSTAGSSTYSRTSTPISNRRRLRR
jgi:hypothetical protein